MVTSKLKVHVLKSFIRPSIVTANVQILFLCEKSQFIATSYTCAISTDLCNTVETTRV